MPTYIMLSTLTPRACRRSRTTRSGSSEVNKEVEQLGANVKAQWATLGHVDFISIVEAPDEGTMARVSLELGSRGTGRYETLAAIPIEDFIAVAVRRPLAGLGYAGRSAAARRRGADDAGRPWRGVCLPRASTRPGRARRGLAVRQEGRPAGGPGISLVPEPLAETEVRAELEESTSTRRASGIVMGSKSDMEAMEKAARELEDRGILHEMRVMSAHREPDLVAEYAKNARCAACA